MREMLRFDPFREMVPWAGQATEFNPQFDVRETADAYVFRADLPGVEEKDLDISLTGNRLTVSGKREYEQRNENDTYYTCERSFGSFTRSFTLPEGVDPEHVQADVKNGVLTLHLPKRPEMQPKKIEIKGLAAKSPTQQH
jgi:HSP20 family protein